MPMALVLSLEFDCEDMSTVRIRAAAKALPQHYRDTADILPFLETWLAGQPERLREKALRIFRYAGVDRRYGILSPEEVFTATSFEEKNQLYAERMTDLGERALQTALEKASLAPEELDGIISVSCTGIMIPSVDAYLINRLGLKQDILRLPVTEMGCAAGVSGLIYARSFLRDPSLRNIAVLALESPTSTFQHDDYSMTNIVSAAIFGDGAACAILSSDPDSPGPALLHQAMYHFYDAPHMMGFRLRNSGLQMVLDPAVPEVIDQHFDRLTGEFLAEKGLQLSDIDHFLFHPGGKKIIQAVRDRLAPLGKDIPVTQEVMRKYGNMSSATVLYVLEEYLDKPLAAEGERGFMLSFGPGFTAQRLLLGF